MLANTNIQPSFPFSSKSSMKNFQVAETSSVKFITKMRYPDYPLHNPSNQLVYDSLKFLPIQERLGKLSSEAKKCLQYEKLSSDGRWNQFY